MQAEAFAAALQEAIACGCDLSQPAEESAFAEIWVEAMVNGYADSCGGAIMTPGYPALGPLLGDDLP